MSESTYISLGPEQTVLATATPYPAFIPYAIGNITEREIIPIPVIISDTLADSSNEICPFLYRISSGHGRATISGNPLAKIVPFLIGRRFYTKVGRKGTEQHSINIELAANEEEQISITGLSHMTPKQAQRIGAGTVFCEHHNIKAERTTQIYQFLELPIPTGTNRPLIPVEKWKQAMVHLFGININRLEERLSNVDIVSWERVFTVAERFHDFALAINHTEFQKMATRVINAINTLELLTNSPRIYKTNEPERFFLDYTAIEAGIGLGRLHKNGVVTTGYCNASNLLADGSLCDLEDLFGDPLGLDDGAVTDQDCIYDISEFFNTSEVGIYATIDQMERKGFINSKTEFLSHFRVKFLAAYIQERWGEVTNYNKESIFQFLIIMERALRLSSEELEDIFLALFDISDFIPITGEPLVRSIYAKLAHSKANMNPTYFTQDKRKLAKQILCDNFAAALKQKKGTRRGYQEQSEILFEAIVNFRRRERIIYELFPELCDAFDARRHDELNKLIIDIQTRIDQI